jgi:hypothetical protein
MRNLSLLALCTVGLACGEKREGDAATGDDGISSYSDGDGSTAGDTGGDGMDKLDVNSGGDFADSGGDDGECPCAPHSDLIYVLSENAQLWTYDPTNNQFAQLGSFNCAGLDPTTFSMGVARDGKAWIMFQPSADIRTVDVNDANNCTDPGYTPNQVGYGLFGMAFASNSTNNPCDRLYAHTFDGLLWSEGAGVGKLGRIDEPNLNVVPLGSINYNGGELTGTGDGRLFAFAGTPGAKLIEYDKGDASVVDTIQLPGLELTLAFAFAFWGGDFYFFTENEAFPPLAKVTKLDYDESDGNGQALTTVNASAPIRIVGAGVSTCAPYLPPG